MVENIVDLSDLFGQRSDTLLVIGNGFDLNLGLKTSYRDFFGSGFWPFQCHNGEDGLSGFLNEKRGREKWFDLEAALADYAVRKSKECSHQQSYADCLDSDLTDYDALVKSLAEYLKQIDMSDIDNTSIAAKVLRCCCEADEEPTVFSFNYTDLFRISQNSGFGSLSHVHYVHGSLDTGIILGFDDRPGVGKLSFMRKIHRPEYVSSGIVDAMRAAQNAVFFGLSFEPIDYNIYFKQLFEYCSTLATDKKYIRIITYDEDSRQHILGNIGECLSGLYQNHDFRVICTQGETYRQEFQKLYSVIAPEMNIDV